MTLTVIPGRAQQRVYAHLRRAMGASPESITTNLSMSRGRRAFSCFVVMDSGLAAEPVIGPAFGRTRWRRPGMTVR